MEPYDSFKDTKDHILRVEELLYKCIGNLKTRSAIHDASKLIEPEKSAFDKCIPKLKDFTYGSPEYKASLKELGPALEHHYKENKHHPEHWLNGIKEMSLFDIMEMLMDWKAATERMKDGGDIWKSIKINRERYLISDQLYNI